ncbi:MAG: serine/threonine protein kinase, partial [Clostridia bacterium]|nr:serine/threonine protein kinase [Clostridia bacterium]
MDSIENTNYIGKTLDDRYRIKSLVGSGGMSRVFLVDDLLLHRELALKMLREDISKDEVAVRRFIHESKAVSMLSHPNIVSVYDVSVTSEIKYIVL